MAMENPKGRANYEPNSWGEDGGPRENPAQGFRSYPEPMEGNKGRIRPESFADHYSQARQFYISQAPVEQKHMADALTFELSKVGRMDIRERMVGHLRLIDEGLAEAVAEGIGLPEMPDKAEPAKAPVTDLPESPALSIVRNAPGSFRGRKLGLFVADGSDADLVNAMMEATKAEGAMVEIVAPHVAGAELSDGERLEAQQKIDGGPSVLYDAVAIILDDKAGKTLSEDKTAQDFVSDAFAHAKFIAHTEAVQPLFETVGIAGKLDDGVVMLSDKADAEAFIETCRALRFWDRAPVNTN